LVTYFLLFQPLAGLFKAQKIMTIL